MWTEHDDEGEELPAALRPHVRTLRRPVAVRPAWRESVLREIAAGAPPRPSRASRTSRLDRMRRARRWSVSPLAAIAAGLLCMVVGASAGWWMTRRGVARAAVASVPAEIALESTVVRFALLAPGAARVTLVGDFNRWDPSATPLRASGDGRTWEVRVPLSPGRHVYAFVVDGGVRADPAAPRSADDDFGQPSSVVLVAGST